MTGSTESQALIYSGHFHHSVQEWLQQLDNNRTSSEGLCVDKTSAKTESDSSHTHSSFQEKLALPLRPSVPYLQSFFHPITIHKKALKGGKEIEELWPCTANCLLAFNFDDFLFQRDLHTLPFHFCSCTTHEAFPTCMQPKPHLPSRLPLLTVNQITLETFLSHLSLRQ